MRFTSLFWIVLVVNCAIIFGSIYVLAHFLHKFW